jgi:hypothetical protein
MTHATDLTKPLTAKYGWKNLTPELAQVVSANRRIAEILVAQYELQMDFHIDSACNPATDSTTLLYHLGATKELRAMCALIKKEAKL